jgi:hypothetical protein
VGWGSATVMEGVWASAGGPYYGANNHTRTGEAGVPGAGSCVHPVMSMDLVFTGAWHLVALACYLLLSLVSLLSARSFRLHGGTCQSGRNCDTMDMQVLPGSPSGAGVLPGGVVPLTPACHADRMCCFTSTFVIGVVFCNLLSCRRRWDGAVGGI